MHSPDSFPVSRGSYLTLYAGFVIAGVATTLMGPMLPLLIARWGLNDQHAGLFFTAQFSGSMAGVASLRWILRRGYGTTLVCGFSLIAAGVAGLNLNDNFAALIAAAVFGFGLGESLSATNLWVAEAAKERRVAALGILNLMWGIGAVASAPLVMLAQQRGATAKLIYTIAACSLIAAAILAAMDLETSGTTEEPRGIGARKLISTRSAISLAALFFLYIGSENSVAGWVASLTRRMSSVTGDSWTLAPMFFWAGLFMGRGLLPLIPLRRSERKLLQSGLLLTSVAIVVLLSATSFAMVAASVTASGLGMAAIFPLLVAWLVKALGERSRQSGWIMFALASMGGATMPWFVGATSSRLGSLRAGLLIPLAGCAVMFTLIAMMTEPIFRETDELNAPVTLLPDKSS